MAQPIFLNQITDGKGNSVAFVPSKSNAMNLATGDFALSSGEAFYIKNNSDESVTLGVKYAKNDPTDDFVDTTIFPSWNFELVVAVEENATAGLDLQWGQ